ncbi:hypothetical protein [Nocardia concava]|uniref:hypothetical protein n=1 Tax=Nocardia concava TaxID=257281 RepID=UPI000593F955|nr:hypothetical protein [Nocardia concava]
MTITAPRIRRTGAWLLTGVALVLWVYPVGLLLLLGSAFSVADTRCGGDANVHPRLNPAGIPWVIGSGVLWAAPFLVAVAVRRTRLTIALAATASGVSLFFMVVFLAFPQQGICW